jgi:hypothetical protein
MLDLVALTDDQREGVCKLLAERFNIPLDEVHRDWWMGVPILTDGVSVGSTVGFSCRETDEDWDVDDCDEEPEP